MYMSICIYVYMYMKLVHMFMSICNFGCFHFGFESRTLVMIAPVPVHCLHFTFPFPLIQEEQWSVNGERLHIKCR